MRRDSIFYKLFQQFPTLLFDLLPESPENAERYRFDSVAVKEPKFEIDGVFLPPENAPGVVYVAEVQFQKRQRLYERVFGESLLYFYRNRDRFTDWIVVVIYPSRSIEQDDTYPYRALLNSDQVYRIYLDELGDWRELPIGMALMILTTLEESEAPEAARYLLARSQQESATLRESRAIMEMLSTILVYKFDQMSRSEVEAMLGISLRETRVYQEAKAEGEEIGEARGEERGEKRGEKLGQLSLILRLLNRQVGTLPEEVRSRIESLNLEQLGTLAEALLDFTSLTDLEAWLAAL